MKQLHLRGAIQRHGAIPFLWRGRCLCGWTCFAPTEERARAGVDHHISEEEPFPDLDLSHEEEETPP